MYRSEHAVSTSRADRREYPDRDHGESHQKLAHRSYTCPPRRQVRPTLRWSERCALALNQAMSAGARSVDQQPLQPENETIPRLKLRAADSIPVEDRAIGGLEVLNDPPAPAVYEARVLA